MNQTTPTPRYEFLDWLRVLAILLLLFFHTGMLFVGWGWHITNAETIPALEFPMDLAHRLRMPLLFVIAGAGMWFALQRRTGAQLFKERTVRLLLPLVIGMFLIIPPQVFYERLFQGQWHGSPRLDVVPAALSRVAPAGSLIVNSSRGGGAKDTWILR